MATIKLGGKAVSAAAQKYKHIRSWGVMLRSMEYYIKGQQEKAARENAPVDAIYMKTRVGGQEERWICANELPPDHDFHKFHADHWGEAK